MDKAGKRVSRIRILEATLVMHRIYTVAPVNFHGNPYADIFDGIIFSFILRFKAK